MERADCDLPLQRFLAMPTRNQKRIHRRDYAISEAFKLILGGTVEERRAKLIKEIEFFKVKGPWKSWKKDGGPSLAATELQCALFAIVSNHSGALMPCSKTIARATARTNLLREVSETCPDTEPMPKTKPAFNPASTAEILEG